MLPLHDEARRPLHFPIVTILIIALSTFVFLLELVGGEDFIPRWALVPADVGPRRYCRRASLGTVRTSMFMHGSWSHVIGNMIFLWAFGPQIEDAVNPWRYAAFYLSGGIVAMLAQVSANPGSTIPNLGASGAIAFTPIEIQCILISV